ncbi:MAG: DUF721 domain-containing protein [Bacillota bacterium]
MQSLGGVLRQLLTRMEMDKKAKVYRVISMWPSVVGKELAKRSRPSRVAGGVLFVEVVAPVWGQQLSLLKSTILARIRDEVGDGVIRDIRFGAGREPGDQAEDDPVVAGTRQPNQDEREHAAQLSSGVTDKELAGAMERVVAQQLALQRTRVEQGWMPCSSCQIPGPQKPGSACPHCLAVQSRRRMEQLRLLLSQVPWCALDRAQKEIQGLTASEYQLVKETLASQWESAFTRSLGKDPGEACRSAHMLAMLKSGRRPGEMDQETLASSLGERAVRQLGQNNGKISVPR